MSIVGRGKGEAKTEVRKLAAARAGGMKPQVLRQRWTPRWDILEVEATRLTSELDAGEEEEGPGKAGWPGDQQGKWGEVHFCLHLGILGHAYMQLTFY